jgi:hypothetical protein
MIFKSIQNSGNLSADKDLILLLISEELKSRRFFNTLQLLGLEDSYYQPHLDEAILTCLGLNDQSNETFDFYSAVMDGHAGLIGIKKELVEEQAWEVYEKLMTRARALG